MGYWIQGILVLVLVTTCYEIDTQLIRGVGRPCYLLVAADALLVLYTAGNGSGEYGATMGSFQWSVYSLLTMIKLMLLYFVVFPIFSPTSSAMADELSNNNFFVGALLALGLPYVLWMARASHQLFGSADYVLAQEPLIFTDIICHVTMDLIDASVAFTFIFSSSSIRAKEIWILVTNGIVMGLIWFLHIYSFPSTTINTAPRVGDVTGDQPGSDIWALSAPETVRGRNLGADSARTAGRPNPKNIMATTLPGLNQTPASSGLPSHRGTRNGTDVLLTRKWVALISVFFADVPLLALRIYLWICYPLAPGLQAMLLKNIISIPLSVFRFAQCRRAEKEELVPSAPKAVVGSDSGSLIARLDSVRTLPVELAFRQLQSTLLPPIYGGNSRTNEESRRERATAKSDGMLSIYAPEPPSRWFGLEDTRVMDLRAVERRALDMPGMDWRGLDSGTHRHAKAGSIFLRVPSPSNREPNIGESARTSSRTNGNDLWDAGHGSPGGLASAGLASAGRGSAGRGSVGRGSELDEIMVNDRLNELGEKPSSKVLSDIEHVRTIPIRSYGCARMLVKLKQSLFLGSLASYRSRIATGGSVTRLQATQLLLLLLLDIVARVGVVVLMSLPPEDLSGYEVLLDYLSSVPPTTMARSIGSGRLQSLWMATYACSVALVYCVLCLGLANSSSILCGAVVQGAHVCVWWAYLRAIVWGSVVVTHRVPTEYGFVNVRLYRWMVRASNRWTVVFACVVPLWRLLRLLRLFFLTRHGLTSIAQGEQPDTDFWPGDLKGTDLKGADLKGTARKGTDLKGTDLANDVGIQRGAAETQREDAYTVFTADAPAGDQLRKRPLSTAAAPEWNLTARTLPRTEDKAEVRGKVGGKAGGRAGGKAEDGGGGSGAEGRSRRAGKKYMERDFFRLAQLPDTDINSLLGDFASGVTNDQYESVYEVYEHKGFVRYSTVLLVFVCRHLKCPSAFHRRLASSDLVKSIRMSEFCFTSDYFHLVTKLVCGGLAVALLRDLATFVTVLTSLILDFIYLNACNAQRLLALRAFECQALCVDLVKEYQTADEQTLKRLFSNERIDEFLHPLDDEDFIVCSDRVAALRKEGLFSSPGDLYPITI
ncbi:putative transmembrane protein [Gregarina niphandrodes]|uniref:Transmembrane protein n=1 Tax=Gregarina niphandrodes TaxID=110365 RepID=A0A023B376_GRENI|nr:putative transmembrane protein [Gregarina niphandrodes]EZG55339.1 putative transmembrane protein [Gregarina niphandrodes]|eukprot:XP_011131634.1 putative transmembrane protein [Gregarina niphandrodes]